MNTNPITVEASINTPIAKVWSYWNEPEHIINWAFASDDWEAPVAANDLRVGGTFSTTMAAKDKSQSFEFGGVYTVVEEQAVIEYDMSDGRHVTVEFTQMPEGVHVVETFDPESENSAELQRSGWQAILDNFKKYAESK
jgi:uncharacterized protein YndB with AHSA1/START domain